MDSIIPNKVKEHKHYPKAQQGISILQFIFAVVNIGLFASYIVRTAVRISSSSGAVVGILAAAITFSLVATLIKCTRLRKSWRVTIALLVGDLIFVAAFIAVSVITALDRHRPAGTGGGSSCTAPSMNNGDGDDGDDDDDNDTNMMMCAGLTSGSLALSILSVISHSLSSMMQGSGKQTSNAGKIENPLNNRV